MWEKKLIQAYEMMKAAKKVFLVTHDKPDGDGLSSVCLLIDVLEELSGVEELLERRGAGLPALQRHEPVVDEPAVRVDAAAERREAVIGADDEQSLRPRERESRRRACVTSA